jgi:hypothetical protein
MTRLGQLKRNLKPGKVYRRSDLGKWSKSVDRHARELVETGVLKKLQNGLYYYPQESSFGKVPPTDEQLVRTFLKDDNFLLLSRNAYNALGLGLTQLYNTTVVYNRKRHGKYKLGNRTFDFQRKYNFPGTLTHEYLLVDLMNNLASLAEDRVQVETRVKARAWSMDNRKLVANAEKYGKIRTKKFFNALSADRQAATDAA